MYPNQFDVDAEIQYRTQRALLIAEQHRLARVVAGSRASGWWQARLLALRDRRRALWVSWLAAVRGFAPRLHRMPLRTNQHKPGEQCC